VQYSFELIIIIIIICSSLNIVFNFKQNTLHYIAENDEWPTIDFKIIRLARVQFELETPVLKSACSSSLL
jgi:hypothetical protein